ncbi:hypothetical protein [Actinoplanes sp. RD1]|uniref:hypothetical protein n=1 Tax=Actinoplanes sp. RD1 TaxID=3064538 RepID=UPI0027416102|nr:hypothetical protein [Actinoplanes sp. RD1]
MLRSLTAVAAGILLVLASGAPARADAPGAGWERIPSPPFDYPAGVPCAFAIHADPVVDAVYYKTLSTHPDGSVHVEAATGPLVYRLTNVSTGATVRGNASASGTATHHEDGAVTMRNHGPLLVAIRAGQSNLEPGYYEITGAAWRLDISATNYRTVSGGYRIAKDLCAALG